MEKARNKDSEARENIMITKMIKLMKKLPTDRQAFILGYTQSEANRLHKDTANE